MSSFKNARRCGGTVFAVLMLGLLLTACSQGSRPMNSANAGHGGPASGASMETVHASYLDLAGNIADLRARVDAWTKGDESSLNIAKEKLERTQAILSAQAWPRSLQGAVTQTQAAIKPMDKALNTPDQTAAIAAAKALGDASHEVTHAFYGDYLPEVKGQHYSPMAPHATYLDITANLADLKTRVAAWTGGDEASLNIAKEKVERIDALLQHAATMGVMAKPLKAIATHLTPVSTALAGADATAANQSLKPLSDAGHDLTHDFYTWLGVAAGSDDPACVQAAYHDLSLNIADLRARVTAWEKGDAGSYDVAQEKLERIGAVLAHVSWPQVLGASVLKVNAAVPAIELALQAKNLVRVQEALKPMSDASHDVTHAFYGEWLPHVQTVASMNRNGVHSGNTGISVPATTSTGHSDSYGHSESATNATPDPNKPLVLGGLGVVNATVLVTAAVLKWRTPKRTRKSAAKEEIAAGGNAE